MLKRYIEEEIEDIAIVRFGMQPDRVYGRRGAWYVEYVREEWAGGPLAAWYAQTFGAACPRALYRLIDQTGPGTVDGVGFLRASRAPKAASTARAA